MQISESKIDPVVRYLTDILTDAGFEPQVDGTLWCPDSNATLDAHEIAQRVKEIINGTK